MGMDTYCGTDTGALLFGTGTTDPVKVYSISIQGNAAASTTATLKSGGATGTLKFSQKLATGGTYHASYPKGMFFPGTPYLTQTNAGTVTITYEQV